VPPLPDPKGVFLNIPYDKDFSSLYIAYIVGLCQLDMAPHLSSEIPGSGRRLDRIFDLIENCRYSIHDLSRVELSTAPTHAPRFNMPLELGMAMARRFMHPDQDHDWLVLVPEGHAYMQFVSDLAAYDPAKHDGSVEGVVFAVMVWLSIRRDALSPITPHTVLASVPRFRAAKEHLDLIGGGGTPRGTPWSDVVLAAIEVARTLG